MPKSSSPSYRRREKKSGFRSPVLALTPFTLGLLVTMPARAASLQKVNQSDWSGGVDGLPSYVNMYIYVPDQRAAKPPIVVGPHHCQGTGSGTYSEMSSLVSLANKNGFIIIFPEATGQNCWDAGSDRSLKHDGKGDTHAIVQMVRYTLSKYNGNANRVYSVGGSSGGIMTEALLGVYPDIFMAGVSLMGVPCGCWAQDYNDTTGKGSTAQWSGPCAGGNVTKTGKQWGDLVRSYFPGYAGHRPRIQHWHGTSDTTLNYKNLAEDVKEWTNLLGLSETPTGTDTPKSGTTRQFWKNQCGYTVFETFALSGVGHAVGFDANAIAAYFGLDKTSEQDPETAACPEAVPGGGSAIDGGAPTSPGGSTGSSGSANPGGSTGSSGSTNPENSRNSGGSTGYGGSISPGRGRDGGLRGGDTAVAGGGGASGLEGAGRGGAVSSNSGGSPGKSAGGRGGSNPGTGGSSGNAEASDIPAGTSGHRDTGTSSGPSGGPGEADQDEESAQGGGRETGGAATGPDSESNGCTVTSAKESRRPVANETVLLLAAIGSLLRRWRRRPRTTHATH